MNNYFVSIVLEWYKDAIDVHIPITGCKLYIRSGSTVRKT